MGRRNREEEGEKIAIIFLKSKRERKEGGKVESSNVSKHKPMGS